MAVILLFLIPFIGFSQVIFSDTITGINPSQYDPFVIGQYTDANAWSGGIARGQGITAIVGNNIYNAANFNSSPRDTSDYFSFSLAPSAGYQINFQNFIFTGVRNSTGPLNFALRSSVNNFSSDIGTATAAGGTISLGAIALQNITDTVEFRLYGWNASSAAGIYGITSFAFNGAVTISPRLQTTALNNFGSICVGGAPVINTFELSGVNLSTDSVLLHPLRGYQYGINNISFHDSLTLFIPGSSTATIYVKFTPDTIRNFNGNIVVSGGGASSINVPVTGAGIGTRPSISNGSITGLTTSGVTINYNINNTGCSTITGCGVEYSTAAGFAVGTGTQVFAASISQVAAAYSIILSSLGPPGRTYYFRTFVTNSGGIKYGLENSFTLLSDITSLSVPATGAGSLAGFGNVCINSVSAANSFSLTGSLLDGSDIIIGPLNGFVFCSTATGTYLPSIRIVNGGSGYRYQNGYLTGCNIYVKFAPTLIQSYNGNITVTGGGANSLQVAVAALGVNSGPAVTTGNAIQITTNSALVQGAVRSQGCSSVTGYGFEYSNVPAFVPGTGTVLSSSGIATNGTYTSTLSGLSPSTVYYYYAFAQNAGGISYGNLNTFYTAAVPTQLVITEITPQSPIALSPFAITVTAVDNLTNLNPINVTEATGINLTQVAGNNVFTSTNLPVAIIPAGSSTVSINGNFYDAAENGVGIVATAITGMTNLAASSTYNFDVIAYTGSGDFTWAAHQQSSWLNGFNWQSGTAPGSTFINDFNRHVARFSALANLDTTATGGCGIDMEAVAGDLALGCIIADSLYAGSHEIGILAIGNSSASVSGVLALNGKATAGLPVLGGNTTVNLLAHNSLTLTSTRKMSFVNSINESGGSMRLQLNEEGYFVANSGNTIAIDIPMYGSQNLHFAGGGNLELNPQGAISQNYFSGQLMIENGNLNIGQSAAIAPSSPNVIVLGDVNGHHGRLNLNGHSVVIGGLSSAGSDSLNSVSGGAGSVGCTIFNAGDFEFGGSIIDEGGRLSLIKNGIGKQTLSGIENYSGSTTINAGTLKLSHAGGQTLPVNNDMVINNGHLIIAANQTLKDVTVNGGQLTIDSGVVLTITGNYQALPNATILNYGKIILKGNARQYFPGYGVSVIYMKDLDINNTSGVVLNNSLRVKGFLNIVAGNLQLGADTLSIYHPVQGLEQNLLTSASSSLEMAGGDAGVNPTSSIHQLSSLIMTNSNVSTLNGHISVSRTVYFADTAGVLQVPANITLNGAGALVMRGGNLTLKKNGVLLPELSGSYDLTGGKIVFGGVGMASNAQTIRPVNYFTLESLNNGGDRILSPSGIIGILDSFIPSSSHFIFTGSTVEFKKNGSQSIPAFSFENLRITGGNNTVKTLTGPISISSTLTMGALTRLALDQFDVTIKSDMSKTARVDVIPTANSILYNGNGRFVVERYIPTGTHHGKTWQFLSVPVSGAHLFESWQSGSLPLMDARPGYGTVVTSDKAGAVQRGFDFYTPAGGHSVKYFNSTTDAWLGVDDGLQNTAQLSISNVKGYMIFVRGDRSVTQYNAPATPTTLAVRGKLYAKGSDAPGSIAISSGRFESISNPYASAIDMNFLLGTSTGIDPVYYVWDPLLPGAYGYGGYQTISQLNGFKPVPGGTANYNSTSSYTAVSSGQAFLLHSNNGGVVNFSEAMKTQSNGSPFRNPNPTNGLKIETRLYKNGSLADGNLLLLSGQYSSDVNQADVVKMRTANLDFSIKSEDQWLAIAAKAIPQDLDTVFFDLHGAAFGDYQVMISASSSGHQQLNCHLGDRFAHSLTQLHMNGETIYSFSITHDSLSACSNRFFLVFKKINAAAPCVNLMKKDSVTNAIIEQSDNVMGAIKLLSASHEGNGIELMCSHLKKGQYQLKVLASDGKLMYKEMVTIATSSEDKRLKINKNISSGLYFVVIEPADDRVSVARILEEVVIKR